MYVIKRDGSKVEFDRQKVINAINAAFLEVDGILYEIKRDDLVKDGEAKYKNLYESGVIKREHEKENKRLLENAKNNGV